MHTYKPGSVGVLLAGDDRLRTLNYRYRGVNEATDVLSFPAPPSLSQIGDIAISLETAERQALAHRLSLDHEAALLAIHGCLHLIGFDDQTDADRAQMLAEMARGAEALGLPPQPSWSSLPHEEPA